MAKKIIVLCAVLLLSLNMAYAAEPTAKESASLAPPKPIDNIDLVYVNGGCFKMGNSSDVGGPEEKPVHEVCVDNFYLGKYEVTQGQWKKIMGSNPSANSSCGNDCPVDKVSWNDAQDFIAKLNAKSKSEKKPVGVFRLPTEAEWEYAARSGGRSETYSGGDDLDSVAWYWSNADETHPVGQKAPNGLGIHDMSGNVWEWTGDWYGSAYYANSPKNNPTGQSSGDRRVVRGGCFGEHPLDLRTTYRNYLAPDYRGVGKGLRILMTAPVQAKK